MNKIQEKSKIYPSTNGVVSSNGVAITGDGSNIWVLTVPQGMSYILTNDSIFSCLLQGVGPLAMPAKTPVSLIKQDIDGGSGRLLLKEQYAVLKEYTDINKQLYQRLNAGPNGIELLPGHRLVVQVGGLDSAGTGHCLYAFSNFELSCWRTKNAL